MVISPFKLDGGLLQGSDGSGARVEKPITQSLVDELADRLADEASAKEVCVCAVACLFIVT